MNDNELLDEFDLPDWACDIFDRHDLGLRADCAEGAVVVLLTDAAEKLKEASLTAFRERAVSHALEQHVKEVRVMIDDAIGLAMLCPRDPVPGIVTELEDGTLQWRDASAPDLLDDPNPPPDADDQRSGETNDLDLIDWSD